MIMFCAKREEDKSGMAGITHRIRFYILGVVLLADSTNDWAGGNEDDGDCQHFGVESETKSDSLQKTIVFSCKLFMTRAILHWATVQLSRGLAPSAVTIPVHLSLSGAFQVRFFPWAARQLVATF